MLERLLITGAAGGLGRLSRDRLSGLARVLRLSDVAPLGDARANEEIMPCDLGDKAEVMRLVEGCDGILHLGGISVEDHFERILNANIVGITNLYEAARKHGRPRIAFASSNHAIGFYRQDETIDARAPLRPDGLYGLSKCYGEAVASLYHDKFGIETAIIRIGSCFPEPKDRRMLSTWLSPDDFISLISRVFDAPKIGLSIVYGVSANPRVFWDNRHAEHLGWQPKDSSARFEAVVIARTPEPKPDDPARVYHGGAFCADPIHEDGA